MKEIYLKKKIIFTFFTYFFLISITLLIVNHNFFTNIQNYEDNDYINQLHTSPSAGLQHDDHAEIHGYADQYVTWSFSTNPSQIINVWVLDGIQYSIWTSGLPASGYLLSTDSSDSGTFKVPHENTWYIVFWNDEIGSQYTTVTEQ